MALNLLNSFGKKGVHHGLLTKTADVSDIAYLSKYFVVSDFSPIFTAGRNSFSLNGSAFLKTGAEILVECLDSSGRNLFIEMATISGTPAKIYAYKEATSFILSIHVYNDTSDGIGKLMCWSTLIDGRSVKWQQNITVDKTLQNSSKVRFYTRPILSVDSVLVPVLNSSIAATIKQTTIFAGRGHGLAVDPPKDSILPATNRRNIDVNYQLVVDDPVISGNILPDSQTFNSQMVGATANLILNKIQVPYSTTDIVPTNRSSSFLISDVVNNKTLKLIDPYFYNDTKNNTIITNISDTNLSITYPYISYNTVTSSYQTSTIDGVVHIMKQCYADVIYKNIRTFSGFLARHKVYRKSLVSNADFSLISDEPLFINELLRDNLTQNKFYELLGKFYNSEHIRRYWFVNNTGSLNIVHSPDVYINSCHLTSSNYNMLSGSDYMIVKNDSVGEFRNATYIPFDNAQFIETSGSAYDSNFIQLKAGVQYLLQVDTSIQKDYYTTDAAIEFYLTSSIPEARKDPNFTNKHGIRLASIFADDVGILNNFDKQYFFYTPQHDLYGTLVIVPYKCQPYLKNISFRVYGDDGFSPDLFISRIPWPITVANETYQIKSELFDINHNLVYSDLNVYQNFDPSGSSLVPYIPGSGIITGAGDATISGSLFVSKSIYVQEGDIIIQTGDIYVPDMGPRPESLISGSRFIAKIGTGATSGKLVYTNVANITHDDRYLYLSTGSFSINPVETSNVLNTRQSVASSYNRKIYWSSGAKQTETI